MITLKDCLYGEGVFATQHIPDGSVLPEQPIRPVCEEVRKSTAFVWTFIRHGAPWLAFGTYALLNHSETPNAEIVWRTERNRIALRTLAPVERGQELTIRYANPEDYPDIVGP